MDQQVVAGLEHGRQQADALVARRQASLAIAAKPSFGGFLIAEGDSWLDYPIFDEITEKLEDAFNYRIESAARWGDTADNILHTGGGDGKRLVKAFEKLQQDGRIPRAILLSCGGNDIAGDRFILLLNHARSAQPGINVAIVAAVFSRLKDTISGAVGLLKGLGATFFQKDVPVVLHGYGRPVPDGRGFLDSSLFSGPWLAPAFEQKGYASLPARVQIVGDLIDRFNAMLQDVAASAPGVHYVDARPVLSNDLAGDLYRQDWSNEMHPTALGFTKVAGLFDTVIRTLPMP